MLTARRRTRKTNTSPWTTVRVRRDDHARLNELCVQYGIKTPRAIELLLGGWNRLSQSERGDILQGK